MYFVIGADIVPTKSNYNLFSKEKITQLIGEELENVLDQADFRIFNLETPLVDKRNKIVKCGPNLIAPLRTVDGYRAMKIDLLTLANNHILDQGVQGLNATMNILKENNISYIGAGDNLADASKSFVFSFSQKKIGVYACAEHEFSIASEDTSGANPFDPLWSLEHIRELKKQCDYVIVLYHGGVEHYRYPSPYLQKICRRLVDNGANLIVCQHSHCIGCEEHYKNSTIVYGQGNFIFDDCDDVECWQTGILIKVNDDFSISYIPVVKVKNKVRIANQEQSKEIMSNFYERSNEVEDKKFIEKKYKELAQKKLNIYLDAFSVPSNSLFYRGVNKITGGLIRKINANRYKDKAIVKMINYTECEAHRNLLLTGLKERIEQNKE